MSEALQAKIDRLNEELSEIQAKQVFSQDDTDRMNQLRNQISELEFEVKQQESLQVREQKFVEHVDSLQQQIQDMDLLGAILPVNQLGALNISLTEHGEMRENLNQLLYAWVTDIQKGTYEVHSAEVAALQKEVRDAKAESAGLQEQVLQSQRQNVQLQREFDKLVADYERDRDLFVKVEAELVIDRDDARSKAEKSFTEIDELEKTVEGLQRQLAEAQKPKSPVQASQSVQEQLEGLRKKSQESWADKANRGLARLGLPAIDIPMLPVVQEVTQEGATFPAIESPSDQLPAAQEVAPVGGGFRQTDLQTGQRQMDGDGPVSEVVERSVEVQLQALRDEQQALKARMSKCEAQLGIGMSA